jgi:phage tail-like protein
MLAPSAASGYLNHLPTPYRDQEFLGLFLKAFEKLLSGIDDGVSVDAAPTAGIEAVIRDIAAYFDPAQVPPFVQAPPDQVDSLELERVGWLASWVALELRPDWELEKCRRLIQEIVSIYPLRGTRAGLEKYLNIYVPGGATVNDQITPFQLGYSSTIGADTVLDWDAMQVGLVSRIGVDTVIGSLPQNFFVVNVAFDDPEPAKLAAKAAAVRAVVDAEKPAHTYYQLAYQGPALQIGIHSRVAIDTLL